MKPGLYIAPTGTPLDGEGWMELNGYISDDGYHPEPQDKRDEPAKYVAPPPPYPVGNIATQKRRRRI